MNDCSKCLCWDSDREGCTLPQSDRWYACPIESELPENKKALEEYVNWLEERKEDEEKKRKREQ